MNRMEIILKNLLFVTFEIQYFILTNIYGIVKPETFLNKIWEETFLNNRPETFLYQTGQTR